MKYLGYWLGLSLFCVVFFWVGMRMPQRQWDILTTLILGGIIIAGMSVAIRAWKTQP